MDILHSKYKIINKIGEGSFSEVLKCEHRETGVCYAAKRLKKIYKTKESIMTCAEIIAAQKLPYHPNILNMFEHHYDSFCGNITFIFELMDMSLHDFLKTKRRGLSEHRAKKYLYQVLRGLEHLHRHGLFHRDVKPENILIKFPSVFYSPLSNTLPSEIIKLADLGSVRGIYSAPPYTEYISTRWYRSPECLLTVGNYGSKMDVWAAGCVFYEMITLRPLFPGSNEIDQLCRIHQILGSPSIQFLSRLKSKSRNCVFFPKLKGTGIDSLIPFISRNGRGILRVMVEYDAEKRINVKRLLRNSYFDDIRENYPRLENKLYSKTQVSIKHDRLKRSMGDDGSVLTHSNTVKPKILKREHYCDEIRKSNKSSAKSVNSSKKHSNHNSATTPQEIPYCPVRQQLNLSCVNLNNYTSLPLIEYKVLKSMGENPTILKRNKSRKKSSEGDHLKAKSNTDTLKHVSDAKPIARKQFQSKSFIIPRKVDHYRIETVKDNIVKLHKSFNERVCNKFR